MTRPPLLGAKLRPAGAAPGVSALPTQSAGLTGEGSILGTLQYMAPEQLEGQEVDARTDIFAFGAMVYEMVTGKRAFSGESQASLVAAILEHQPVSMVELDPITPLRLNDIVETCLTKDPDDRWQSARDLGREVGRTARSGSQTDAATIIPRPATTRRTVSTAVAASMLVAVIGVLVGRNPPRPIETPVVRSTISVGSEQPLYLHVEANDPVWTPDSQRVIYLRDGPLRWRAADGSGPEELLPGHGGNSFRDVVAQDVSPDGALLVVRRRN